MRVLVFGNGFHMFNLSGHALCFSACCKRFCKMGMGIVFLCLYVRLQGTSVFVEGVQCVLCARAASCHAWAIQLAKPCCSQTLPLRQNSQRA